MAAAASAPFLAQPTSAPADKSGAATAASAGRGGGGGGGGDDGGGGALATAASAGRGGGGGGDDGGGDAAAHPLPVGYVMVEHAARDSHEKGFADVDGLFCELEVPWHQMVSVKGSQASAAAGRVCTLVKVSTASTALDELSLVRRLLEAPQRGGMSLSSTCPSAVPGYFAHWRTPAQKLGPFEIIVDYPKEWSPAVPKAKKRTDLPSEIRTETAEKRHQGGAAKAIRATLDRRHAEICGKRRLAHRHPIHGGRPVSHARLRKQRPV